MAKTEATKFRKEKAKRRKSYKKRFGDIICYLTLVWEHEAIVRSFKDSNREPETASDQAAEAKSKELLAGLLKDIKEMSEELMKDISAEVKEAEEKLK